MMEKKFETIIYATPARELKKLEPINKEKTPEKKEEPVAEPDAKEEPAADEVKAEAKKAEDKAEEKKADDKEDKKVKEAKKPTAPKPRDPNSQYMNDLRKSGAMGAHKDKKKMDKIPRKAKHKGKAFEAVSNPELDNLFEEIKLELKLRGM